MKNINAGQERLLRLAGSIEQAAGAGDDEQVKLDFSWLAAALRSIATGSGVDIASALGVKAKRGQRTNRTKQKAQNNRNTIALAWLNLAMTPLDTGGLGLTLDDACALAGEDKAFGLTEETIRSYWGKNKQLREQLKRDNGIFKLGD